jgi:hypothetical protein
MVMLSSVVGVVRMESMTKDPIHISKENSNCAKVALTKYVVMLLISYFSINTAAAITAVQSHDHRLNYTTHIDIHLAVTLTHKCQVYWNLLDKTSDVPQTKKLGYVGKKAERTTILKSTIQGKVLKYCASMLKCLDSCHA